MLGFRNKKNKYHKEKLPWPGSSVDESVVLRCQGCGLAAVRAHGKISHEYICEWNKLNSLSDQLKNTHKGKIDCEPTMGRSNGL